jgi:CDP-diacylglycerol---serine O-phosphatidyltransferase
MQLFNLPNILTLINLFAGCLAVVFTFNYQIELVPYCVLVSLVADFFDGFAARLTKSSSDIGKQLDSLADVVSFGLVPGAVLFQLLFKKFESGGSYCPVDRIYLYSAPAFLVPLFAALRLAKFNVDTRQTDSFIGLATPAMAIFVIGYQLAFLHNSFGLAQVLFDEKVIYVVILALCGLMVAELPMFSFKFKSFGFKGNELVFLFIILSAVLLATLKFAAISLIIIVYILISLAMVVIKSGEKVK